MELRVLLHDVRKVEAEALVVGCFEDVRPLKGMAGELDWLLCGGLSHLLLKGHFTGALGDTALTTSRGKIKVGKLFMVGMGPQDQTSEETTRSFSRAVAKGLLNAGVASSVIEYVPVSGQDESRHLRAIQDGLREGSEGRGLTVQLLVQDPLVYERISRLVNA
ncbi:MAG: M17 family peptidase N-terminal domain-containing protein [Syntrophaceae bacterium]